MTTRVKINRLPTGVPGLDEVLGGGLPELSFNLIAGQARQRQDHAWPNQLMFSLATPSARRCTSQCWASRR
jgi:circadian clock protein KaiC